MTPPDHTTVRPTEGELPVEVLLARARPFPDDIGIPGLSAEEHEAFLRAIEE